MTGLCRQIKRPPLAAIQRELRAVSGTLYQPGDRARRYLLWRQLDRAIRHRERNRMAQPFDPLDVLLDLI